MQTLENKSLYFTALLAVLCAPAYATVQITALTPSPKSPQVLGTPVTWTVTATDSNPGPLTFQFNVAIPAQSFAMVKDFNVGTLAAGTWTSQPFVWVPTGVEGVYKIEVVIKDFTSGETASKAALFQVTPLAIGTTSVVNATANPLVALFSAPSCASGSSMAVRFQPKTKSVAPAVTTPFQKCHPPATMNFEIAGMYPTTEYQMVAETETSGKFTLGNVVAFSTGAIPTSVPIPKFTVNTAAGSTTDTTDWVVLQNLLQFGVTPIYPAVATDLSGNIMWYYNPGQSIFLTRPLQNGTFLTMQSGPSWDPASTQLQLLDQIDFAGNIIKETNIGVLSQQLVAMGATDAVLCNTIAVPAPVGSACIDSFHHDAIQTLPNGDTAALVAIEKIFPAGTQGDTTGLPVDIIGDMIIVMNNSWQVIWYFDAFQHDTGAPQLDYTRPPVLGETCSAGLSGGCPEIFLVTSGISPKAKDWLHANALYYWPQDKDIIMSMRNQDWVVKIDYNNGVQSGGLGTGNILWRMGPCGDFTFTNTYNDPWPWFSHQHEFGIENSGAGPITVFDNGNTRWSQPTVSTGCMPGVGSGNSRGMALNIDEAARTVSPVLSQDMGYQSYGDGSAQLLTDGNYSFLPSDVFLTHTLSFVSYIEEILPSAGTDTGTEVLNIQAPQNYRIWRMPSMYAPPIT